jgi:hypothetical protein
VDVPVRTEPTVNRFDRIANRISDFIPNASLAALILYAYSIF